jgi:hypothetical protein
MIVTGDHGMVEVLDEQKVDLGSHPELVEGVRMIAGEPRARYVYARPGAEKDVLPRGRTSIRPHVDRVREQAIADGWFGPGVRIGSSRIGGGCRGAQARGRRAGDSDADGVDRTPRFAHAGRTAGPAARRPPDGSASSPPAWLVQQCVHA